jgi:hypothetical protein
LGEIVRKIKTLTRYSVSGPGLLLLLALASVADGNSPNALR